MQTYLSFDCGFRTLAYCHLTINTRIISDLRTCESLPVTACRNTLRSFITIHKCGVIDVTNGVKLAGITEQNKIRMLKKALTDLTSEIVLTPTTTVVIERQPVRIFGRANTTNHNSRAVASCLMYHFADYPITLANSADKNKLHLTPYARIGDKYYSGKRLAVMNLKALFAVFRCEHALVGIKNAVMDDFADSIMQVIAIIKLS